MLPIETDDTEIGSTGWALYDYTPHPSRPNLAFVAGCAPAVRVQLDRYRRFIHVTGHHVQLAFWAWSTQWFVVQYGQLSISNTNNTLLMNTGNYGANQFPKSLEYRPDFLVRDYYLQNPTTFSPTPIPGAFLNYSPRVIRDTNAADFYLVNGSLRGSWNAFTPHVRPRIWITGNAPTRLLLVGMQNWNWSMGAFNPPRFP